MSRVTSEPFVAVFGCGGSIEEDNGCGVAAGEMHLPNCPQLPRRAKTLNAVLNTLEAKQKRGSMTPILSSAIRAAAEEIWSLEGGDPISPSEYAAVITKHLSPILNPPAGEEAKRAALELAKPIGTICCEKCGGEYSHLQACPEFLQREISIIKLAISQSQAPLVERIVVLQDALDMLLRNGRLGDHSHWDRDGNAGRTCPVCQDQIQAKAEARQALTPKEKV